MFSDFTAHKQQFQPLVPKSKSATLLAMASDSANYLPSAADGGVAEEGAEQLRSLI